MPCLSTDSKERDCLFMSCNPPMNVRTGALVNECRGDKQRDLIYFPHRVFCRLVELRTRLPNDSESDGIIRQLLNNRFVLMGKLTRRYSRVSRRNLFVRQTFLNRCRCVERHSSLVAINIDKCEPKASHTPVAGEARSCESTNTTRQRSTPNDEDKVTTKRSWHCDEREEVLINSRRSDVINHSVARQTTSGENNHHKYIRMTSAAVQTVHTR